MLMVQQQLLASKENSAIISCYAVTIFTHQSSQNMMMSYITIRSEIKVFVQVKKKDLKQNKSITRLVLVRSGSPGSAADLFVPNCSSKASEQCRSSHGRGFLGGLEAPRWQHEPHAVSAPIPQCRARDDGAEVALAGGHGLLGRGAQAAESTQAWYLRAWMVTEIDEWQHRSLPTARGASKEFLAMHPRSRPDQGRLQW